MANTPDTIFDAIADHAADGLLARLEWMTLDPKAVLVLGGAEEKLCQALQKRFPGASINNSDKYDIVIANLILPYKGLEELKQWRTHMQKGGLLLATTLGPDTLRELPDQTACAINRIDMHDVGDALVQTGLVDPVMEVEPLTLAYTNKQTMLDELAAARFINIDTDVGLLSDRPAQGCAGRPQEQLRQTTNQRPYQYDESETRFNITCELIYGHAWLPLEQKQQQNEDGETLVSFNMLRKQLRGNRP